MTREEQIIEAGAYHSYGRRPPKTCGHNMHELAYISRNLEFEAGAKWADANPQFSKEEFIDKAYEWLELHINDDKYYSCIGEETLVPYLIEDFRKAIEKL